MQVALLSYTPKLEHNIGTAVHVFCITQSTISHHPIIDTKYFNVAHSAHRLNGKMIDTGIPAKDACFVLHRN